MYVMQVQHVMQRLSARRMLPKAKKHPTYFCTVCGFQTSFRKLAIFTMAGWLACVRRVAPKKFTLFAPPSLYHGTVGFTSKLGKNALCRGKNTNI